MKVTVAILNYNSGNRIIEVIKCAEDQTYKNIEILVYDDNSKDSSVDNLKYFEKIGRIKLLVGYENKGAGYGRRKLVEHAQGDFICFFDDDDFSHSNRVEKQLQSYLKWSALYPLRPVLIYSDRMKLYNNGRQALLRGPNLIDGYIDGIEAIKSQVAGSSRVQNLVNNGFPTCALFARKSDLEVAGNFSEEYRRLEDIELVCRMLRTAIIQNVEEILIEQKATFSSHKTPSSNLVYELQLLHAHKSIFRLSEYRFFKFWLRLRAAWFEKRYLECSYYFVRCAFQSPKRLFLKVIGNGFKRILHEFRTGQIW